MLPLAPWDSRARFHGDVTVIKRQSLPRSERAPCAHSQGFFSVNPRPARVPFRGNEIGSVDFPNCQPFGVPPPRAPQGGGRNGEPLSANCEWTARANQPTAGCPFFHVHAINAGVPGRSTERHTTTASKKPQRDTLIILKQLWRHRQCAVHARRSVSACLMPRSYRPQNAPPPRPELCAFSTAPGSIDGDQRSAGAALGQHKLRLAFTAMGIAARPSSFVHNRFPCLLASNAAVI